MAPMAKTALTPHGELLDRARITLGISQREASRRAGISEGRWRQIVTGIQRQGGVSVPVNPKASTLVAMSRAVRADAGAVLDAAGVPLPERLAEPHEPDHVPTNAELAAKVAELERLITELAHGPQEPPPATDSGHGVESA